MTEKEKLFLERNKYRTNVGHCVICKQKSHWNEEKGRYERLCSEVCKKKYVDIRNKRVLDKYGTTNLADDIDFQKNKLMANRSIAKVYTFKDGGEKIVLSNIEYKVLEYLDSVGYTSDEVDAPASFVIIYNIDGQTKKHIPDIYIKSLNLIISCKDGMDNPNTHPSFQKDRKKNIAIYKSILDNYKYNYIQIEGEKEIKAIKSIMETVKKLHSKKARVIIPPRIDFILYNESQSVSEDKGVGKINYLYFRYNRHNNEYSEIWFSHDLPDNFVLTYVPSITERGVIAVPTSKALSKEEGQPVTVLQISGDNIYIDDILDKYKDDTLFFKLAKLMNIDTSQSLQNIMEEIYDRHIVYNYHDYINGLANDIYEPKVKSKNLDDIFSNYIENEFGDILRKGGGSND